MNDTTSRSFSQSSIEEFARKLHKWGANVLAIKPNTKKSIDPWQRWQTERQTTADVDALSWNRAAAVGIVNGINGWRVFDIDAPKDTTGKPLFTVDLKVLQTALKAIGLPEDYQWSYVSGSGAAYAFVIRCYDTLPWPEKGIYRGQPIGDLRTEYDHLELRWSTGQTVIHGAHPTGPGYHWRKGLPFVPPAERSAEDVVRAFESIALLVSGDTPPEPEPEPQREIGFKTIHSDNRNRAKAYAGAALSDAIRQVSTAAPGGRNNTLFSQTASLAELVNGGLLDGNEVTKAMESAALAAGLDQRETAATIKSAMKSATEARTLPDDDGRRNGHYGGASPGQVSFHNTDIGNAERLVARYGDVIRYIPAAKEWRIWNGKIWETDTTGAILRMAKRTARGILEEAAAIEDDDARKATIKHAMGSERRERLNAMIALAQAESGISASVSDFDNHPYLLTARNGIIDLRTGKLIPHDRGYMASRMTDVEYDPSADCPTWEKFLDTIFAADDELIRYVQRASGYNLTGDTSEQCFFQAHGKGRNGKSTFIHVQAEASGDFYYRLSAETVQARTIGSIPNDIAQVPGRRLIVASELEQGRRMAEALVKDLTGGDDIKARFLFGEYFQFRPQAKLWIVGNHKLQIRGTDDGIWRRVRLIPFEVQIPLAQVDKHLIDKLRAEMPGILAWMVRGCLDWQRQGLNEPATVIDATQTYREEMDFLADYLADCCEIAEDAHAPAGLLYQAFRQWCKERGEKEVTQRVFGTMLRERGFERVRKTAGMVWYGVRLSPEGRGLADAWGGYIPLTVEKSIDI